MTGIPKHTTPNPETPSSSSTAGEQTFSGKIISHALAQLETFDAETDPEEIGHTRVGSFSKAEALLVAVGMKPASIADYYSKPWAENEKPPAIQNSSEAYCNVLQALGLFTATAVEMIRAKPDPLSPHERRVLSVCSVYAARSPLTLEELIATSRDDNKHQKLGLLLGYPPTSVDAFVHNQKVFASDIPNIDPAIAAFSFFTLSQEHSEQELAIAALWVNKIREISSTLYENAMRELSRP